MSVAYHVHGRQDRNLNPLARAWRALFAAWDDPAPASPVAATSRHDVPRGQPLRPSTGDVGTPRLVDLPAAPLYVSSDAAEAALLRMLEGSVASALDLEERADARDEPAHPALVSWRERRAS